MRRYCGFLSILLLCASLSEAFINKKDAANSKKHNQVRGGFARTRRFSPHMMAISSSQLSRKAKGLSASRSSRTRVRYANDDSSVLTLPPRGRTSPGGLLFPPSMEESRLRVFKKQQQQPLMKPLDLAVFCTYLCSALVMNLPIVLLPMAAAEHATGKAVSSLVVSITSIAIMGGGLGKVMNGFVCQEFGGKKSSALYLVASAACCLLFSMASVSTLGYAYAGIEFCASMQWTALSVVFAQHYEGDATSFAKGITCLSLASTCGQLLAKFLGMTLLHHLDWRTVAQLGALVALVGAGIVHTFVSEQPVSTGTGRALSIRRPFRWKRLASSIQDSAGSVLSNPLFWAIGYAHAMSMVARSSDRILGEFFSYATGLPRFICGGLTLSVTVGLVHGLVSGRAFHDLKNVSSQTSFVTRRYIGRRPFRHWHLPSWPTLPFLSLVESKFVMAGILTTLSAIMTSCMAFQFFQIPSMVAQTFGEKKAVCISWIDATAFFINAPVWACVGHLVETQGWSVAFIMIAALFGLGGMSMTRAMSQVLEKQES